MSGVEALVEPTSFATVTDEPEGISGVCRLHRVLGAGPSGRAPRDAAALPLHAPRGAAPNRAKHPGRGEARPPAEVRARADGSRSHRLSPRRSNGCLTAAGAAGTSLAVAPSAARAARASTRPVRTLNATGTAEDCSACSTSAPDAVDLAEKRSPAIAATTGDASDDQPTGAYPGAPLIDGHAVRLPEGAAIATQLPKFESPVLPSLWFVLATPEHTGSRGGIRHTVAVRVSRRGDPQEPLLRA